MKSIGLAAIMRAVMEKDSSGPQQLPGGPAVAQLAAPTPPRVDAASIQRSKVSDFQAGYDAVKNQGQRASMQWSAEFVAGRNAVLSWKSPATVMASNLHVQKQDGFPCQTNEILQ